MTPIHGCMVFESIAADASHELLQAGHPHDSPGSKGIERIVSKLSLSDIGSDHACSVIRADSAECDGPGRRAPLERADSILFTENGPKNGCRSNPNVRKEVFRPVAAMEEHAPIRIIAIVIIPIDEGARPSARKLQH